MSVHKNHNYVSYSPVNRKPPKVPRNKTHLICKILKDDTAYEVSFKWPSHYGISSTDSKAKTAVQVFIIYCCVIYNYLMLLFCLFQVVYSKPY